MTWAEYMQDLNQIEREMVAVFIKVIHKVKPKRILEVGSGWGVSARCFLEASEAILDTVDKAEVVIGKKGTNEFALRTAGFENRIKRITGDSKEILKNLDRVYDIIYIDGDHGYETVKQDTLNALYLLKENGVILFDDVWHRGNWLTPDSCGVSKALKEALYNRVEFIKIYPIGNGLGQIDYENCYLNGQSKLRNF